MTKSEKENQRVKQHDTQDVWFPWKYLCLREKGDNASSGDHIQVIPSIGNVNAHVITSFM